MNQADEQIQIQLNALADGELPWAESEALLSRIEQDSEMREALCDIHRLKDMVRYAYADHSMPHRQQRSIGQLRGGLFAAAILLFSLGFAGGWLLQPTDTLHGFELGQIKAQPNKVVLFVSNSDPEKFAYALERTEQLLREYSGQGVEVNLLTSAGGIDLLRTSSPFVERIKTLSARYASSVQFVACNNTIARLVREGKPVELVDTAVVKTSAVQFVVERLKQGWSYQAI